MHGNVHYTMHAILHNVLHNMLQWLHMLVLQTGKVAGAMETWSHAPVAGWRNTNATRKPGSQRKLDHTATKAIAAKCMHACMHAKDCTVTLSAGAAQVGKTESFGAASNAMPLLCLELGTALGNRTGQCGAIVL